MWLLGLWACHLPLQPGQGMRWDDLPGAGGAPTPEPWAAPAADPAALAERWWVIVASAKQAPAPPPGLAKLGLGVVAASTSEFAGLAPCWTALIAGSYTEQADALALRDRLTAAGIDAYAKFAGVHLGASAEIGAWCARQPGRDRLDLVEAGDPAMLRLDAPAPVQRLVEALDLQPRSDEAWFAELAVENLGAVRRGDPVAVMDLGTGERRDCRVAGFGAVAVGLGPFGDEPAACGPAEAVATLDCALSGDRWVVATPTMRPWAEAGAVLDPFGDWPAEWIRPAPGYTDRGRSLTRWREGERELWLAEAWVEEDGPCGGDEARWWAWVDPVSRERRNDWVSAPFSRTLAVVQVDEGLPEILREESFGERALWSTAAELARRRVSLCMCPC